MQHSLNVVVIGGGYFANFHINAWQRLPQVNLVAIVEQNVAKHKDLKDKTITTSSSNTVITDSLRDAVSNFDVDIIDIATPPHTHHALITEAISFKCSFVVCQKPFCGSYASAKAIHKSIAESTTTVVIHENFRFQPWYRTIKTVLENNTLGTTLQAQFRLRPGDGQGPDAYLERQPYFRDMDRFLIHETGIHYIDVFRFLFGEPSALSAELRRLNPAIKGEDAGYFVFHYDNGLRVHFDGNRLLDHAADNSRLTMGEMLIEGTQGSLTLNGTGEILWREYRQTLWQPIDYQFDDNDFGGDCVYHTQKHIVSHLLNNTPLENNLEEYLRNLELEEAVYEASATQTKLDCKP